MCIMSRKNSLSSSFESRTGSNIVNWIPIEGYLMERCFPHLFKLTLQQMRLQRAILGFLADEGESDTIKASSFGGTLKASIIEEKQRLIRLLKHHVSHLQSIGAPYLIIEDKLAQVNAVEETIEQLGNTEPGDILKSTLEEMDNTILTEYLDLVTSFAGESSNWPIGKEGNRDEKLLDEILRF
jgi:hypothetical protein